MGIVKNIGYNLSPKASENVGKRIEECYVCEEDILKNGIIVRDDIEEPFETIIRVENIRYIRAEECQFSTLKLEGNKNLKKIEYNYDNYPKQTENVNRIVMVCYHFDTSKIDLGVIVRDDDIEPFETIIRLKNGKYIRAVECQYRYA